MERRTVCGADDHPATTREPRMGRRPIRVLHVITRMILGGAQENTLLSCALIDRGSFPSEILAGPETGVEGELFSEARRRGVDVHVEPALVREIHPFKDAIALARMTRFLERSRYDIVHTHTSKAGVLGRLAAHRARVPIVIHTAHGWPFRPDQSRPVFWTWLQVERRCARWTHAIVDVAESVREDARVHGVGHPDHHVVIRSGVELEPYRDASITRAEARARAGVPEQAFVVGCVGRLNPQKQPFDLLASFARLVERRPDAHLVVVGDGELRARVEARMRALGLAERVHLLGLRHDVPTLLRAFDVFALPSLWEGLPRVFSQAMAARLPIVANRVNGAAEAVESGVTGWLVPLGDRDAFADRLLDLASNPERARCMGERGRERIEAFSAARMVRQLEELYHRLAVERGIVPDAR
jgi:glycosyltransferase involved in cell wall biosynthesis